MNGLEPLDDQAGEPASPAPASRYDATILEMAAARGEGKSFCPSEVARALSSDDWRPLLTHVRAAARRLAEAGQIDIPPPRQADRAGGDEGRHPAAAEASLTPHA